MPPGKGALLLALTSSSLLGENALWGGPEGATTAVSLFPAWNLCSGGKLGLLAMPWGQGWGAGLLLREGKVC